MTDKPINLNKVRKAQAQAKKRAQAIENVISFGRTKAEKTRDAADTRSIKAKLDAHKRT